MYVFQADTYCDACGEQISRELTDQGLAPQDDYFDSDDFPVDAPEEDTDGPDHCASRGDCKGDAVDLRSYGLAADAELIGAETYRIGELLSNGLTDWGVNYLREMLAEPARMPYQVALYAYWTETFADYLEG